MVPTLGITCDFEQTTNRRQMVIERHVLSFELVERIASAGARPVLLPHLRDQSQHMLSVQGLDGLVVSGGDFDVPPSYYGQRPHPALGRLRPERTSSEMALLALAWERRLPILGLCGGMQILNVFLGGTLLQDTSLRPALGKHEQPGDTRLPFHDIQIKPNTRVARWLGTHHASTNSTHHQVIDDVAPPLMASAWAPDGGIEAIEAQDAHRIAVGVQWHPELIEAPPHRALFEQFVAACRQRQ